MQNVQEKMQAISAAQNAFATIESIRPGAIPQETKVLLAELKVDLNGYTRCPRRAKFFWYVWRNGQFS